MQCNNKTNRNRLRNIAVVRYIPVALTPVLNFKLNADGISDEIAVKNCTVLLKPRLAELKEFLMIQLSRATADFLTRKIIQYFSRAARG